MKYVRTSVMSAQTFVDLASTFQRDVLIAQRVLTVDGCSTPFIMKNFRKSVYEFAKSIQRVGEPKFIYFDDGCSPTMGPDLPENPHKDISHCYDHLVTQIALAREILQQAYDKEVSKLSYSTDCFTEEDRINVGCDAWHAIIKGIQTSVELQNCAKRLMNRVE